MDRNLRVVRKRKANMKNFGHVKKSKSHVVWFKRDLRVCDHLPLLEASSQGTVIPLFIVEPGFWKLPDISMRQWDFVSECVAELQVSLASLGQPLVIRVGNTIDILTDIHRAFPFAYLWSHEETGNNWTFNRDKRVAEWCAIQAIDWRQIPQSGVMRGLKSREGWSKNWSRFMTKKILMPPLALRPIGEISLGRIPSASDLGLKLDLCPSRQEGGRSKALENLESFLTHRSEMYLDGISSPLMAAKNCSRLSPYLAWGAISLREVVQNINQRQRMIKARGLGGRCFGKVGLKSFLSRLHWHCHFIQKLEDEPDLEIKNLHPDFDGLRFSESECARLGAWATGETGLPFLDACMRFLRVYGWLNFRMRAMLMAFSSYHLWIDWKKPGEHLARSFIDYEPGIHWPQVQMQSGTTGINAIRIYNPIKQGYVQDPRSAFVREWIPELIDVPDCFLHEPWLWPKSERLLGKRYPFPIVDHLDAAKCARAKMWAVKSRPNFKEKSNNINIKHGSRKVKGSGILTSQKSLRKKRQLSLPFDE